MGRLASGGMREDIESMERKEDYSKLYIEFALRSCFLVWQTLAVLNRRLKSKRRLLSLPFWH